MSAWPNIVQAESNGSEVLLWLVVTVIWIVAQILTRARRKPEAPTASPPAPSSTNEPQDIEDFLKLLRQQFEVGEAKPATPSPPPPVPKSSRAHPPHRPAVNADREPKIRRAPSPPAVPTVTPHILTVQEAPTITPADVMPRVSFESVRRDILSLKVGFSSRGLRLPEVRITSKFHRRTSAAIQKLFHRREGLKEAVIAHQVLGAPRSVRAWLYPEN